MIDLTTEFGRAVARHLENQYVIWLTTIDSTLTPQPRPVWFVWENGSVLIFSQPHAHKVWHIRNNPNVALHFNTDETGDKHVIILTGTASIDPDSPPPPPDSGVSKKVRKRDPRVGNDTRNFQRRLFDLHPNYPCRCPWLGVK